MRQSKRELYRQIEELDDEHDEGLGRIEWTDTVIATGWGDDDADPSEVIREETMVIEP